MQVPVFGQNPALAAAQPLAVPAALKDAGAAAPADAAPPLPGTGPAVPVDPTSAKARAPMGFLEMAMQAQHHREESLQAANAPRHALFGDDGFDFGDVLDIINPLQHIPIISTLYRAATGDTIETGPRLAGGALYGGVIGLMGSAVDAAIEDSTGHDIGENVRLALFGGPEKADEEPVMFASADPGPAAHAGPTAPAAAAVAAQTAAPAPAAPDLPPSKHPLTPEQIEILSAYNAEDEQPAAVLPANGPEIPEAAPPGAVTELSPEQEKLLLQSLGLAPPDKAESSAKVGPQSTSDAVAIGDAAAQSETKAETTPQPPAAGPTLPSTAPPSANDPDFAQRMKYGLERYFAHPMPHNPDPPKLDQTW